MKERQFENAIAKNGRDDRSWAMEEFEAVDLADRRLNRRLVKISESMARSPESPISQACGDWAETKAAYRFFGNEQVQAEEIMKAHSQKTVSRCEPHEVVLAIQDTSYLVYTSHRKTKGLGEISIKKGKNVERIPSRGLVMHACMAVTTEGLPLGLLNQSIFAREPKGVSEKASRDAAPVEEKESYRWIDSLRKAKRARGQARMVTVCDREADFYDFLLSSERLDASILVRANVNRDVNKKSKYAEKGVAKLWGLMESRPVEDAFEVEVSLKSSDKHGAEREARTAKLELRYGSFKLNAPRNHIKGRGERLPDLPMSAVYVIEPSPPEGVEAIEWMLLTDLSIESSEEARRIVRWYSLRWRIEMFFKALKSGFKVLECRLGNARRLERYITVMSIIAWRMLMLTYLARERPSLPCDRVLDRSEWIPLYAKSNKGKAVPEMAPSINEAVAWIARLGGHLGRKGDGPPGMITIWRGWKRLADLSQGWCLSKGYNTCG